MYDYKLIEAYSAVIQEGGFEKAARSLNITQSAVSQRVKLLEEEFGQILLLRTIPPEPTPFGTEILRHYRQVSRLEDDLRCKYKDKDSDDFTSLSIGINADSLATWFFGAMKNFLKENNVVLDLLVDDQEETHQLLRDGKVLGCISTRESPIQGCNAVYLGKMEYSLFCSQQFYKEWFHSGVHHESVKKAPMITFNHKDELNLKILKKVLGKVPEKCTSFYVPSMELFLDFIQNDLAYGAMPEQQSRSVMADGNICNLTPEAKEQVALYWHCWNIDSKLLGHFTKELQVGFSLQP